MAVIILILENSHQASDVALWCDTCEIALADILTGDSILTHAAVAILHNDEHHTEKDTRTQMSEISSILPDRKPVDGGHTTVIFHSGEVWCSCRSDRPMQRATKQQCGDGAEHLPHDNCPGFKI